MKAEFLALAEKILRCLERTLSKDELKEDYVYKKIPQLIGEVKSQTFSSDETDLGLRR